MAMEARSSRSVMIWHSLGAAGVELDVAELVQLCRCLHSATYADPATMPAWAGARWAVAW